MVVGNYHLAYNSPCVDSGDSDEYTDEFDADGELRVYGTLVDIGADEAHSCDDEYLTEDDVWNSLDWNADGLVNLKDFTIFSQTWLRADPNEFFDPRCDLDEDDDVDLDDLALFSESWLWTACWKQSQFETYGTYSMMSGGSENMMTAVPMAMTELYLAQSLQTEPVVEEKSIFEQILNTVECIQLLEQIWLEDPYVQQEIDPNDWQKFMDAVYESLEELKVQSNRIE